MVAVMTALARLRRHKSPSAELWSFFLLLFGEFGLENSVDSGVELTALMPSSCAGAARGNGTQDAVLLLQPK